VLDRPAPGGGDQPARLLQLVFPVYPYDLAKAEKGGTAKVEVLVDTQGVPATVRIVSATDPAFGLALAAAALSYHFTPGYKGSERAMTKLSYGFDFDPRTMIDEDTRFILSIEKNHPEVIRSPRELDVPVVPVSRGPVYPPRVAGPARTSLVTFLIDGEGRARLPRVNKPNPDIYDYAAMQAVSTWIFTPPKYKQHAAFVRVAVPIEFPEVK
jgi:outer membrane biosynthesis protein TonB